ncbi:MAG: uncharacterized protein JWM74_1120, partial [Myxococcaceae bacterium]|nr:uncharacterized protein [Myxococcaceae bacterium]
MTQSFRARWSPSALVVALVVSLLAVLGPRADAGPGTAVLVGPELAIDASTPGRARQESLTLASDGVHFILAWKEARPRGTAIRAARLRISDGVLLDPIGFDVLADETNYGLGKPSLACKDAFQCLVAVTSWNNVAGQEIIVARFSPVTATSDDPTGRVVTALSGAYDTRVATNGKDYVAVTRSDSLALHGIVGMRIDASTGDLAGGTNPVVLFPWAIDLRIASDGADYFVTGNAGNAGCIGTRRSAIDLSEMGSPISFGQCFNHDLTFANGHYVEAWTRGDSSQLGSHTFLAARVRASDGASIDASPIVLLGDTPNLPSSLFDARIVSDGVSVLASSYRGAGQTAQRLDVTSGAVTSIPLSTADLFAGGAGRFLVGNAVGAQVRRHADDGTSLDTAPLAVVKPASRELFPRTVCGTTNCFAVWVTDDNQCPYAPSLCAGYDDYLTYRVRGTRFVRGAAPGEALDLGLATSSEMALAYDGSNYIVAWRGAGQLVASRVRAADGAVLGPLHNLGFDGHAPELAATNAAVMLGFMTGPGGDQAATIRLNPADLSALDASPRKISSTSPTTRIGVVSNGTDFLIAWDGSDASGQLGVRVQRMTANGLVLDPAGVTVAKSEFSVPTLGVGVAGGNYLFAYRASDETLRVGRVRPSDGALLDSPLRVVGSNVAGQASFAFDGSTVLVAWPQRIDALDNRHRVVAQRLSGIDLVSPDATPFVVYADAASFSGTAPQVAAQPGGPFAVVTSRFILPEYDNERLRVRYVSADPPVGADAGPDASPDATIADAAPDATLETDAGGVVEGAGAPLGDFAAVGGCSCRTTGSGTRGPYSAA